MLLDEVWWPVLVDFAAYHVFNYSRYGNLHGTKTAGAYMDGSIPLQQPGLGVWWSTWSISTPRPSAKCVAAVWDSLAVKQEGSVRTLDQATQGNVVKVQSALMVLEYFFSECQFGFNCCKLSGQPTRGRRARAPHVVRSPGNS